MNRKLIVSVLSAACVLAAVGGSVVAGETAGTGRFEGKSCNGAGDEAWLRLIDESFAHFLRPWWGPTDVSATPRGRARSPTNRATAMPRSTTAPNRSTP